MRPEKNPLDLNNLPDDYTRDGKVVFEEGFSSGSRKKKNGGKDGKDECGKVYECRFCSLKFCKSQALGGHMNRHRQERETETLNRARQLVFNNDTLSTQAHLGYHPVGGNMGDPTLQFRSVYSPRMLPPPPPPPSQQPYLHPSPSRLGSYTSQYPINDYYVGHVLGSTGSSQYTHHQQNLNCLGGADTTNYTCIGAPVGFGPGSSRGADVSMSSYAAGGGGGGVGGTHAHQRLENPSAINRFQDGF